jgi:predicted esterase YcpF (UPF0227 family)
MLIYIHGFNSSALSFKAAILRKRMAELRRTHELWCPELPHRPLDAIGVLERFVVEHRTGSVALIGSSLGGFYASWLAERHALKAVLVNPAMRPYELLEGLVGPQTNLYTGERYWLTREHLEELRSLEVERITPQRYLLMVETGDEVLDYRRAVARYAGAEQILVEGGEHGFASFEACLPRALVFCGLRIPRDSR